MQELGLKFLYWISNTVVHTTGVEPGASGYKIQTPAGELFFNESEVHGRSAEEVSKAFDRKRLDRLEEQLKFHKGMIDVIEEQLQQLR